LTLSAPVVGLITTELVLTGTTGQTIVKPTGASQSWYVMALPDNAFKLGW
jgi:hypothetical protein